MATGEVEWSNDQEGFGLITAEDQGGKDVFVRHSVIEGDEFKTLQDGEVVGYDAEDGAKGLKATRVKHAAGAATADAPSAAGTK